MTMQEQTLLALLQSRTTVDCDTLDASVAASLGPFQDCTSNQAIAYAELLHTHHEDLIRSSIASARELTSRHTDISIQSLGVEICMINLALQILPHLNPTGRVHIQVNPFDAYSTARTVASARRVISLFTHLAPSSFGSDFKAIDRVCIKIPSTYEGLQACRILERDHGVSTLATTLFSLEQAAVAAEAGCRYIAPYVNELAVHFQEGFIDPFPNQSVCLQSQLYFQKHGYTRTSTLPASLTTVSECMVLAGVSHITIAPALLQALHTTTATAEQVPVSLFDDQDYVQQVSVMVPETPLNLIDDEEKFRIAFTRRDGGLQEIKQVKAINVFADMQVKLEEVVSRYLE